MWPIPDSSTAKPKDPKAPGTGRSFRFLLTSDVDCCRFETLAVSAFKNALALREVDSEARLELAVSLVRNGDSAVLFEDEIAFWRDGDRLVCAVIDPFYHGPESPERFQSLIESARQRFGRSSFSHALGDSDFDWMVVKDYGTGTIKLWPK